MTRILREPVFQFALAAAAVFLIHALVSGAATRSDTTIRVSTADMERMAALYASEAGALPGPEDIQAMIADHVETRALAREARRLGLDDRDTVVERRLAQKMRFMVDDLASPATPDEETLRDWYDTNTDQFRTPARVSFDHVFFTETDDDRIAETQMSLNADGADWRTAGDPFMLQRTYGALPLRETVRLFGADFAAALSQLDASDEWEGPVASALGVHLVRIQSKEADQLPPFEDIRAAVEKDWEAAERRRLNAEAVAEIIAGYDVQIEGVEE